MKKQKIEAIWVEVEARYAELLEAQTKTLESMTNHIVTFFQEYAKKAYTQAYELEELWHLKRELEAVLQDYTEREADSLLRFLKRKAETIKEDWKRGAFMPSSTCPMTNLCNMWKIAHNGKLLPLYEKYYTEIEAI
jgi:DNA anti-recombination protein RmuC